MLTRSVRLWACLTLACTSPAHAQGTATQELVVATTRQPNEGISPEDLTTETADRVGNYWRDTVRAKMPEGDRASVSAQTTLMEMQGARLAVAKLRLADRLMGVMVFGVVGADVVRVQCLTRTGKPIPIFSGPCGKAISAAFGVSIR